MEKISTKNAPAAIGPYSQGMIVGNMIYTSGQIPINPETGNIDYNLYNLLVQKVVILQDNNSSCEFLFDFEAAIDSYYEISFKICNIGTTTIPEKISSQFVVPNAE